MNRRTICELGRKLDQRLGDQDGDRVEIAGVRFKAEALRFERDRAAAAERVDDGWQTVGIPAPNFGSRFFEDLLVVRRFPRNQPLDDVEQPLPLALLVRFGGKQLRVSRRVINELGEQHSAACGERAARPPQMERAVGARAECSSPGRLPG